MNDQAVPQARAQSRTMSAGDRSALRSLARKEFLVLHEAVDRRRDRMHNEIDVELDKKYEDQQAAIRKAQEAAKKAHARFLSATKKARDELRTQHPALNVKIAWWVKEEPSNLLDVEQPNRTKERDQARQGVKPVVDEAHHALHAKEAQLVRDITLDGLSNEAARRFMDRIPSSESILGPINLDRLTAAAKELEGN